MYLLHFYLYGHFYVCSLCCIGRNSDIDGPNLHQHLPKESKLRRSPAVESHQSADHSRHAHHVPYVRQCPSANGIRVYRALCI